MRIRLTLLCVVSVTLFNPAFGQSELADGVAQYVKTHQGFIVRELVTLLSIPDVAADRTNIRRKATLLRQLLENRGFSAELLETSGNPLVFGSLVVPGAQQTLLLYCHYDGQPVDPAKWQQDDPFQPILREGKMEDGAKLVSDFEQLFDFNPDWRIYARSASDDTSPIVAVLAALDALQSLGRKPASHLKIILDGEEEAGSPNLVPAIQRYRDRLAADLMLILDGPIHPSNRPTVVFGARGIQPLQLTVYGPKFSLHSGHYGNWVPNPAFKLARLLASMKDDSGKVTVAGFYEGIQIPADELAAMAEVPDDEAALMQLFGIGATDRVGSSLQEARNYPSLNIRGMQSGWVGSEARTIIPATAVAEIDVRLVPETPPEKMVEKVVAHIRREGFHVIENEPDDETRARYPNLIQVKTRAGTRAYRTPMTHPLARRLISAIERVQGQVPVRVRTSGGTVPISPFIEAVGFPAASVPIVNFDNNQHSPNENLRLGHLFEGIVTISAVLTL